MRNISTLQKQINLFITLGIYLGILLGILLGLFLLFNNDSSSFILNNNIFLATAATITLEDEDKKNITASLKKYDNLLENKAFIILENKNKSGIYRFTNILTGDCYIGSSVNMSTRFYDHFNLKQVEKNKGKSIFYWAILKYGLENFTLEILENCSQDELLIREQYYLDLLKPAYNILKTAGNTLGYKHTDETKEKLSDAQLGKTHTDETKAKISESQKGNNNALGMQHSEATKEKISEVMLVNKHALGNIQYPEKQPKAIISQSWKYIN